MSSPVPLPAPSIADVPAVPDDADPEREESDTIDAAVSVIEDIFSLFQELISKGPSDLGIANSLNSLKSI